MYCLRCTDLMIYTCKHQTHSQTHNPTRYQRFSSSSRTRLSNPRMQWSRTHQRTSVWDTLHVSFTHTGENTSHKCLLIQTSLSLPIRAVSCPYSDVNFNKDGLVPDRLSGERPVTLSGPPRHRRAETLTQTHQPTSSASTPEPPDTTTDTCPQARPVREHVV